MSHSHTPIGGLSHTHTPVDEAQSHFQAALEVLVGRGADGVGGSGSGSGRPWKPLVPSAKAMQRQIAQRLCGWSLKEEEVAGVLQRLV